MKKSKADKLIFRKAKEGKLIMGISAGIFVLMEDLSIVDLITPQMNIIGLKDKKGIGIIQKSIIVQTNWSV